MEFDDLPPEMVLMIFLYLPQPFLEVIARVSQRWMKLAFDACLYTSVCIDSGHRDGPKQMQKILERATMLRRLQVTFDSVDFDMVAAASTRLGLLNYLEIPGCALRHRAMPAILERCKSLKTMKLWGRHRLTEKDVTVLKTVPSLKRLVTTDRLRISDATFSLLCRSCPGLESLKLSAEDMLDNESWGYLECFHQLRVLSVDVITTTGLLYVSRSCPALESLEIGFVWNNHNISMAEVLQGFRHLKLLNVYIHCGEGWLLPEFRAPPLLERFDVSSLTVSKKQLDQLMESFRQSLRHVHIDVSRLPDQSLRALSSCKKIECLHITGLKGKTIVFSVLSELPELHRASLHVVAKPADAVYELMSIVDTKDKSPRGKTCLLFEILCSSLHTRRQIKLATNAFRSYLTTHTAMTTQHILEFHRQTSTFNEEFSLPQNLETSLPTVSSALKYLTVTLSGV